MTWVYVWGVANFAGLMRRHGFEVEVLAGGDGTVASVADLMGRVDMLFVACHGMGGSNGQHAFLLAAEGQLPPMLTRQPALSGAPDFLLDWDELRTVVTGHGPMSQERLEFRRVARADTAWVRDTILAAPRAA